MSLSQPIMPKEGGIQTQGSIHGSDCRCCRNSTVTLAFGRKASVTIQLNHDTANRLGLPEVISGNIHSVRKDDFGFTLRSGATAVIPRCGVVSVYEMSIY